MWMQDIWIQFIWIQDVWVQFVWIQDIWIQTIWITYWTGLAGNGSRYWTFNSIHVLSLHECLPGTLFSFQLITRSLLGYISKKSLKSLKVLGFRRGKTIMRGTGARTTTILDRGGVILHHQPFPFQSHPHPVWPLLSFFSLWKTDCMPPISICLPPSRTWTHPPPSFSSFGVWGC
jgi:hypothetical protein